MDVKDIVNVNYKMFKECPYEILNQFELKEYPKEYIICHQDQVYDFFYVIAEGLVNIYRISIEGKKYSQAIYRKGDYFGELEVFSRKPYVCSVETITEAKVWRISRTDFLRWVELDKNFLLYLINTMCDSFYRLSKKAGEDTLYPLKYRICNFLLRSVDEDNLGDKYIEIPFDRERLSEQIVATTRSINRILKQLKEKDNIDIKNKSIIVKDLEGLKQEEDVL